MQIGVKEAAQKLLRDYGDRAEAECDARARACDLQGDQAVANGWRRVKEMLPSLRCESGASR